MSRPRAVTLLLVAAPASALVALLAGRVPLAPDQLRAALASDGPRVARTRTCSSCTT